MYLYTSLPCLRSCSYCYSNFEAFSDTTQHKKMSIIMRRLMVDIHGLTDALVAKSLCVLNVLFQEHRVLVLLL